MPHLVPVYSALQLGLSAALALAAIHVLLEVATRVRSAEPGGATLWWAGGSVAVGTGLWASHLFGLDARKLPFAVGYAPSLTTTAWVCALVATGVVLAIARARRVAHLHRYAAAALVVVPLTAMFAAGHAAVGLFPGFEWGLVMAAAAVALATVLVASLVSAIDWSLRQTGWRGQSRRAVATLGCGVGYAAVHFVALSAASAPFDAIRSDTGTLDGDTLTTLVLVASSLLLACTLFGSLVSRMTDRRRSELAGSLESAEARLLSANDELRQRAFFDALTGLPNRLLLEDRLAHAVKRIERAKRSARGSHEKLAVLFIDIDGFMPVNQTCGHAGGDEVLRQCASRIAAQTRTSDTVARFGADQFLVLVEGVVATSDCLALAARIIDAVKAPIAVGERRVQISVSVGVVVHPDQGERDKLVAHADVAMRAAKRVGRGTCALFEARMEQEATEQLDLINDLRQALDLGQLQLHYQPKIDARRAVICGVEALLRWQHPTRGMVSPAVFIPIAERFGFINALGNWVIDEACRQMEAWRRSGIQMRVAINLSVHQLREADLVDRIDAALARHGIESQQLLCEITESVAMQDFEATQRTLDALGRIGVYLSIDDFGTGYSSLSYLRQLPARQLKIDRSFINDLEPSSDARAVVDAVVRLAHALGLRVVAEGVETAAQRDILLRLGCDELQGFFFARPMSADKLLEWTHGKKPKGSVDFARSLVAEAA